MIYINNDKTSLEDKDIYRLLIPFSEALYFNLKRYVFIWVISMIIAYSPGAHFIKHRMFILRSSYV